MQVKVHPHKPLVDAGVEACVSITPNKRHGRAYYMGMVILANVKFSVHESGLKRYHAEQTRNVHAWMVGDVIHEATEQYRPTVLDGNRMVRVEYVLDAGRFIADDGTDVTDGRFNAGVIVGKECYVSKEW